MGRNRNDGLFLGLFVAALLIAVSAFAIAAVALSDAGDDDSMGMMGDGMMGAMSGGMHHMQPLPIDGIENAPSSKGGTPLKPQVVDGEKVFKLDARPVWWTPYKGQRLSAYAYNGIVPGPEIRVKNGDEVRIEFTNKLPVETTVHWHGIGVPNSQDGVPDVTQKPIEPGDKFTYSFKAVPAGDPDGGGTFLYHTHVEEDRQMPMGLYGTFIIDPPSGDKNYAVDETLVFSEWTANARSGRSRGVMQMPGMFPNFFTINGKSFPDTEPIDVPAGKQVQLRLVNAGQFAHPIHLHGTAFRVVARDGHKTSDSGLRDTITLESGERADIVFKEPKGKWLLHCHIGHHLTNDGNDPGGLVTVVNAK